MNENDILFHLSYLFKLTPENINVILHNSDVFEMLKNTCKTYETILNKTDIKQKNFLNISIVDFLLTNLDSSNIKLYSIYVNLFTNDINLSSFC